MAIELLKAAARIIQAPAPGPLAAYAADHRDDINQVLAEHGAVVFRGFVVREAEDFQAFIEAWAPPAMNYVYRSTPRKRVDRDVFTATEYPRQLEIPLHCENAYQRSWPMLIALCCITPAGSGGQTPIAAMGDVTRRIPQAILARFADLGVRYVRHYHTYLDLSWQEVFQTDQRDEVARFCAANGIGHAWLDGEILRTEQTCQGLARHPRTGERVFFNQAHLFHPSALGASASELAAMFVADRLPRNATYGDGSEIEAETLDIVRNAFAAAAVDLDWRQGDVAVLDNMRYAHGRRTYSGERRVLASLLAPYAPELDL